jgi:hypothetical protein
MTGDTRWRRRPHVLWRRSLDALVYLPVGTDEPRTLGVPGPEVWELLAEPRTLDALVAVVAGLRSTDPAIVRAEVEPVLRRLVDAGAVEALA